MHKAEASPVRLKSSSSDIFLCPRIRLRAIFVLPCAILTPVLNPADSIFFKGTAELCKGWGTAALIYWATKRTGRMSNAFYKLHPARSSKLTFLPVLRHPSYGVCGVVIILCRLNPPVSSRDAVYGSLAPNKQISAQGAVEDDVFLQAMSGERDDCAV